VTGFELAQLAVLGFFTGMGTTLGAELAKELSFKAKAALARKKQ
jgi:hypothetical protein